MREAKAQALQAQPTGKKILRRRLRMGWLGALSVYWRWVSLSGCWVALDSGE
jgi:hypothetical protein